MTKRAVSAPDPTAPDQKVQTITVRLSRPVGTLAELVLKRPTAAELRPLPMRVLQPDEKMGRKSGATWGDMLSVVSGCSGVALEDLRGLASMDAVALVKAVNVFLAFDLAAATRERVRVSPGSGLTVLTLARPLQLGSERLERLELMPCTGKHLENLALEPSLGDLLELGGQLSLQAPAIIDRLDIDDALPLIELCAGFFGDSPAGG